MSACRRDQWPSVLTSYWRHVTARLSWLVDVIEAPRQYRRPTSSCSSQCHSSQTQITQPRATVSTRFITGRLCLHPDISSCLAGDRTLTYMPGHRLYVSLRRPYSRQAPRCLAASVYLTYVNHHFILRCLHQGPNAKHEQHCTLHPTTVCHVCNHDDDDDDDDTFCLIYTVQFSGNNFY